MINRRSICLFVAGAIPALALSAETPAAADAADIRQRVAECVKVMDANKVAMHCWCEYYALTWYSNGFGIGKDTERDPEKMAKNFLDAGNAALALDPLNVDIRLRMGEAYVVLGRYREALQQYDALDPVEPKLWPNQRAQIAYERADAWFGLGEREKAVAALKKFVDLKIWQGPQRGQPHYPALCKQALALLTDAGADRMKLPVSTAAKPYPEPQEAKYTETFAPLKSVKLALAGLGKDDARVRLLASKLARMGVTVGDAGDYAVSIAVSSDAPVAKSEGYALETTASGATIRARDLQGALWGIVSFLQLVDPSRTAVRVATIRDWPDTANRGYIGTPWNDQIEFTLFQKMNVANIEGFPMDPGRYSPLRNWVVEEIARRFREFGLDVYFRIAWIAMDVRIPMSEPWVYDYHLKTLEMFAKMKANVYWASDDLRYPIADIDKAKGLNASDLDGPHIARLYKAVKAKYPDWKFIYCPPFYWGPDSRAPYPDDREKFLKTLRALPPEVDIYWTGPRVKGYKKTPEQVKWFTELTGHKPLIFQNGTGPHNLLGYITDETGWLDWWHYDGFFQNDIAGFHKNSFTPSECTQIATLGDCLWNVKGYEMHRSIRAGVDQLLGDGMYETLKPGQEALGYFDKYRYGSINEGILQENMDDLRAKRELAKSCWDKAVAMNHAVKGYGAYERAIGFVDDLLKQAKNPPDYLKQYRSLVGPARALAEKDCAFDAKKGDILYLPTDLAGGQREVFSNRFFRAEADQGRFVKFLRARNSTEFTFECDPFPAAGPYELVLCGADDLLDAVCPIEIVVNGQRVYKGKSGLPKMRYGKKTIVIPHEVMKRYNRVSIENTAPAASKNGLPFVALNYVLIRKTAQDK